MWMFLCGASIVCFAHGFIDPFKQQKNFVLAAIYIGQAGSVQWHTLYQNRTKVCYSTEEFDFNVPVSCIKFALRLHNLCFAIDSGGNAGSQIMAYKNQVDSHVPKLKSFYTGRGMKCDATDSDKGNGRARDDTTELDKLEAHGYNVEPDCIKTEDGIFESLQKLPSNLLTVFRPSDPDTMLVAKKIRKELNELEILRLIHLIQPQSEHIITLLNSFHGQSSSWVILPKIMNNVEDWLRYDLKRFSPHFSPVCWGLIEGLVYLHKHHMAHRDIKPENLLVDHKFYLKIIDFDIAVHAIHPICTLHN
ncbi:hypothetical protein PC9H_011362 [Pleurotus ostreatus]|uniref:Protein kinase domain-containing protein n=1 Tax=Pleurotus ostreatus TaxID=5322 RepID=A0A8H6ZIP2_PLEOS|nr:uncharacterized protein PC9H_011362 [Pleurotus ostreatus]KAF7420844.1 hypothetical protein PC9H_011362 [Pleurotus ostreatus]